ncbi:MAG: hypothetical protein QM493_07775 [Sulfurovum sp.]
MYKAPKILIALTVLEIFSIIIYTIVFHNYWFLFAILSLLSIFIYIVPNANLINAFIVIIINSVIGYFISNSFILFAFIAYLLWFLNCSLLGISLLDEERKQ